MKIAVNALPVTPGMTGIGAYTLALVAGTAGFGHPHSYLYIRSAHGPTLPLNGAESVEQIAVESPSRLWEQLHLPGELVSRDVDLYHSPLFSCPIVQAVPSVITIHDMIPEIRPDLCSEGFLSFYRSVIGPSLQAAQWIITTSDFSKREAVENLDVDENEVHVIYQGVSEERFTPENRARVPELRARLGLPKEYVLFVGMIDRRKNVGRLIAAFGQVAKELGETCLVIVGRKDEEDYSIERAIVETGVENQVFTMGYVTDEDLATLHAGASVFVFPSLYEGFGRPIIEAMASGVPVISSNTSSLPEITDGAALLVDPEDVDAIADGLLRLYRDEELRSDLSERGLTRAREFTHRRFGERMVEFYNRVEHSL